MRDYVITTDSCCDFDDNLIRELDVTVIPLSVQLGQDHFRNLAGEMPPSGTFYARLRKGESVQTSAPNVEAFKAAFRPFLEAGKDVLYLGFSSALSATCQNAAMAAREMEEAFPQGKVVTMDTLCASLGQGMLVDLAVQEKRKGKTLEEVAAFVQETIPHLCHWFTVGDLSQLRRGGRLSAGKAIMGNLLHIKPVLHVDDQGRLVPVEQVKGRKKSIEALLRHMEETAEDPASQRVYISHGDCKKEAEALAVAVQTCLGVASVTIGDVGPVIGAHAGAGTLALFFLGKAR